MLIISYPLWPKPKLGPIADWGLQINRSAVEVNTFDYSTNVLRLRYWRHQCVSAIEIDFM